MKHGHLIATGVPGDIAIRLIKCVLERVAMLTLEQVPRVALGQCTNAPLVSLAVGVGSMRRPYHHSGACNKKSLQSDDANLPTKGNTAGLFRPVLTRTVLGVGSDQRQRAHYASCTAAMAWISAI
jgi:hypothetical protein